MTDAPLRVVLRIIDRHQDTSNDIMKDRYKTFGEAYLHGDPDFRSVDRHWQWIELE